MILLIRQDNYYPVQINYLDERTCNNWVKIIFLKKILNKYTYFSSKKPVKFRYLKKISIFLNPVFLKNLKSSTVVLRV